MLRGERVVPTWKPRDSRIDFHRRKSQTTLPSLRRVHVLLPRRNRAVNAEVNLCIHREVGSRVHLWDKGRARVERWRDGRVGRRVERVFVQGWFCG